MRDIGSEKHVRLLIEHTHVFAEREHQKRNPR